MMITFNWTKKISITFCMLFLFFVVSANQKQLFAFELGSVNPKFIQWKEAQKGIVPTDILRVGTSSGEKATGWIPSPLPEEVYQVINGDLGGVSPLVLYPARFDLSDPNLDLNRTDSKLTAITDQGACGVCWAFAGYFSYE